MKSITTILLLCLCTVLGVQAQEIRQHDKFWDGVTLWEVNAIYGGKTVFMVGTGEIYLSLEKVAGKSGEYKLVPSSQADDPSIPGAEFGWRVQYIRKDGMNFLAVRKSNGDAMWTMVLTPDDLNNCMAQEADIEREIPSEITSNTLLNRYYLSKIPNKQELRLMRNEILARHGYRFSSPDLQEWFGELSWYKPGKDNNAIKLNIIEETNIQLIKSEEAGRHPVTAKSLVGEWRWVGSDVPELILVLGAGSNAPLSNGLKVESLYRYRMEGYKNPGLEFDGENIRIRKDVGEDKYIDLYLKPDGNNLTGRCVMVGLLENDFDGEITLRRDYFEYDKK